MLFALLSLAFTAFAIRCLRPRRALIVLLPLFVAVALGNALTHVFWLFRFGAYAPGVATSALLLIPLTVFLIVRVLRERLVPAAYVISLSALALIQPLGAAAAGSTLSGPQLALQRMGARLAAWLLGP